MLLVSGQFLIPKSGRTGHPGTWSLKSLNPIEVERSDELMEFILEEIDIKDEHDTYDLDTDDLDLGSSTQSVDWKLNPNVECRVMLERVKHLHSEKEAQRDSDENGERETDTSSEHFESVDKSCGVYRKLTLLVDVLKNCEKRDKCGLCEKYIQQLQQHLLLTHRINSTQDAQEYNSIHTTVSQSDCDPNINLDGSGVPFEQKNLDLMIPHDEFAKNSEDELVPSLTIRTEREDEPVSLMNDENMIKQKLISKVGKSKPFMCETCGIGFLTFYDLTQHKTTHTEEIQNDTHNMSRKMLQIPSESNQQGLSTGYQNHLYECDVGQKGFRDSYQLNRDKVIHTKQKAYECDNCGMKFDQQRRLKAHKLSHVKSFKCDLCGKCFAHNSGLTRHKFLHTGEKPYRCELCGKCFGYYSHLRRHIKTHTGQKPFTCDLCGKCFALGHGLKSHKLTHTGEKPYRCELCGNCFTQPSTLSQHILTHTGEKPYKCELCGKRYNSLSTLRKHKLIHSR